MCVCVYYRSNIYDLTQHSKEVRVHLFKHKWFPLFLCNTNDSIYHHSFVCTQLNVEAVLFYLYLGHLLKGPYHSTEIQSAYLTAPADWAVELLTLLATSKWSPMYLLKTLIVAQLLSFSCYCDVALIFISGEVWHLTLRKISPSQDSYFGHMVLAKNVGVNLGLDSSSTLARGFPISLSHTPPSPSFSYPFG